MVLQYVIQRILAVGRACSPLFTTELRDIVVLSTHDLHVTLKVLELKTHFSEVKNDTTSVLAPTYRLRPFPPAYFRATFQRWNTSVFLKSAAEVRACAFLQEIDTGFLCVRNDSSTPLSFSVVTHAIVLQAP